MPFRTAALAALTDAAQPGPDDTLVLLGDYIDRGPDSRGVPDQLVALRRRCRLVPLFGNHEGMLLASLPDETALHCWLSSGERGASPSYGVPGVRRGFPKRLPDDRQPAAGLRWAFPNPQTARAYCSGKAAVVGHTPRRNGGYSTRGSSGASTPSLTAASG